MLDRESQMERDIYLRNLLTSYQGPLTNKLSVDKPYLQFYEEYELKEDISQGSLYNYLINRNKHASSSTCINYFGKKESYQELISNIDKTAAAFYTKGIRKRNVVTICMPFTPEFVYTFYALNKLGAIANIVDPKSDIKVLEKCIKDTESKDIVIIAESTLQEKIANLNKQIDFRNIISVSPYNSMNMVMKNYGKLKISKFIKWDDFIKERDNLIDTYKYEENSPVCIIYSNTMSENPKGVILSNENINYMSLFYKQSVNTTKRGDKFLQLVPPYTSLGLVASFHCQFGAGSEIIMEPKNNINPKKISKLITKYRPEYIIIPPDLLKNLYIQDPFPSDYNLSFIKGLIVSADIDKELEKNINEYLRLHRANIKLTKGLGKNEISSCMTYTKDYRCNTLSSVGIPLSKNTIKVLPLLKEGETFDINRQELPYIAEGELVISGPTIMLGYNNVVEDENTIYYDKNNTAWLRTGYIVKVNNKGIIFPIKKLFRDNTPPKNKNMKVLRREKQ